MIGVGENDARAQFFQRVLRETFYRGGSAHRHEYRRFDDSVGSRQLTSSRPRRIAVQNFKRKTHSFSVLGFKVANPIAIKTKVQIVKISIDLHSVISHFADSSGKNAPRFVATGLLGSIEPLSRKNTTNKKIGVLTSPTMSV